jgi:predicted NUDIX family phosphoesterase
MSDRPEERVLAVPTAVLHEAGAFQGFTPRTDHYLPRLLDPRHFRWLPRSAAEADPTHKQLIPYVVLRWRDQLFHYRRGKAGNEARLRALRSVGVGGHVSSEDAVTAAVPYREAMLRELAEEVYLDTPYAERCLGLINDDGNAVGQVHLGIVHVFDLAEPRARRREEALAEDGFAALTELRQCRDEFETWSRFVLDALG